MIERLSSLFTWPKLELFKLFDSAETTQSMEFCFLFGTATNVVPFPLIVTRNNKRTKHFKAFKLQDSNILKSRNPNIKPKNTLQILPDDMPNCKRNLHKLKGYKQAWNSVIIVNMMLLK